MRKLFLRLLPGLLLLSPHCLKAQASIVYLVFVQGDPGIVTATKDLGYKDTTQPIQQTGKLLAPNTNYYLLFITPASTADDTLVKSYETLGKTIKISETKIETVHNDQRGGDEVRAFTQEINPLPADFYKNWLIPEVKISSK